MSLKRLAAPVLLAGLAAPLPAVVIPDPAGEPMPTPIPDLTRPPAAPPIPDLLRPLPAPPAPDLALETPAYAVEEIRCEGPAGVWVLAYEGRVIGLAEGEVRLRLDRRIGLRYHPEREGVDSSDWWCIPKRRFCYSEVGFGDWGGPYRPQQGVSLPRSRVFPAVRGLLPGLREAMARQCP